MGAMLTASNITALTVNMNTGTTMKLSGYPETLKVRAVEAKPSCPTRHHWDSYFRDAKHMNEMKPGKLAMLTR